MFGLLFVGFYVWGSLFLQLPKANFQIYFLDVGQGDAIFIKTPQNHQILIDGGPQNKVIEELAEVMPFFDKTIDMVILTHPHADHVEGLVEVLKRYKVQNVLITGVDYPNSAYEEFLKEIKLQGINFYIAEANIDFIFGEVFVDVLYPFKPIFGKEFENINNSSIATMIAYGDYKILLSGDLEEEKEAVLVNAGINLEAEIYKAGHHGSRTASSIELLRKIKPNTVVIQCGIDNKFEHPHAETLRNFYRIGVKNIMRTDEDGRVLLEM